MTKIRRIVIQDFRAYKGTQTFSFDHPDGPANLVVIYAPNGYGKTSFFDAVEWSFSDRIGRFEHLQSEISRREFAEGNQILLTHRKSFEEHKNGRVEIYLTDGRSFSRGVAPRKITGRDDCYYDYRDGIYDSEHVDEELIKTLHRTNILTQDQIDSFLRYKSPEAKFQALAEFWPEGDTAVRTYKNLDGYHRVLRKAKSQAEERKREFENKISEILNTEQNVGKVNQSINELVSNSQLEFDIRPIAAPVTEAVYGSLREAVFSFVKKWERRSEALQGEKSELQELNDKYDSFLRSAEQLEKLRIELADHEQLTILHSTRNADNDERRRLVTLLNADTTLLQTLQELEAGKAHFLHTTSTIQKTQEELKTLLTDNSRSNDVKGIYDTTLTKWRRTLTSWRQVIENYAQRLNSLAESSSHYHLLSVQADQQQVLLNADQERKAQIQRELGVQQDRKAYLVDLQIRRGYLKVSETEIFETELKELFANHSLLIHQIKQLEDSLKALREETQKIGELNENIERILLWSESFITATGSSQCPVCTNSFDSMEELLGKVRGQKTNVLNAERQQEEIDLLENNRSIFQQQAQEKMTKINGYLEKELSACEMISNQLRDLLTDIGQQIAEKEGIIAHLKKQMENIISISVDNTTDKIILKQADPFKAIELDLREEKSDLEKKTSRLTSLIEIKQNRLDAIQNAITVSNNRRSTLEIEIQLNENDQAYQETVKLVKALSIPFTERLGDLNTHIQIASEAVKEHENKLLELGERSLINQQAIQTASLKVTEEELPAKTTEIRLAIQKYNDQIDEYARKYGRLINTEVIWLTQITERRTQNEKTLEALANERVFLDALLVQLELINDNVLKLNLEEDLNEQQILLAEIEKASARLDESQRSAIAYIDGEINRYFNKDVINQIYSRIEPHPELNEIEFIPEVTGNSLILDVKASGLEDKVNPVLYLSAGQLNVLSLSIFLAKVFETSNKEISTIFMDDPVQNLSDINVLSFIDLIRSMVVTHDKQIVISTHDEQFFQLIKHKLPASDFTSKFIEFENFGKIKEA